MDDEPENSAPFEPPGEGPENANEEYVALLSEAQFDLLRYITTLLGNPTDAQDILQQTNLVLWRKSGDFERGTSFRAWSQRIAYFQVKAFVRDRGRDRHVFSEELVAQLAMRKSRPNDDRQIALRHCISLLEARQRELLRQRYSEGLSIRELAQRHGRGLSAVKVGLMRLRSVLLKCIQSKLAEAT